MSIYKSMASSSSSSSPPHHVFIITINILLLVLFVYCNNNEVLVVVVARNISSSTTSSSDDHKLLVVDDNQYYYNSNIFDQNYYVTWGEDHVFRRHQGNAISLTFDESSGSGFGSHQTYGSGYFHLRLKVPGRYSAGVCTAFYMNSHGDDRDEIDFEFLGPEEGEPLALLTNVFVNGEGGREEVINLWFDPSEAFHTYKILWNQHQIVLYVDNIPIRVYKNRTEVGGGFPTKPMQIETSIWDASDWAYGGGTKINWPLAPFEAVFRGFNISDGCLSNINSDPENCHSDKYWWNREDHWTLNPREQRQLQDVRNNHLIYDYCEESIGFHPECIE